MKEVEITVKVDESLDQCVKRLEAVSFKKIRESFIKDIYLTQLEHKLKDGIEEVLNSSVLLRYLKVGDSEFRKITYKRKNYDTDGALISETKINLNCEDLDKAKQLFEALGFNELITVEYSCPVYEKDGFELAFQKVKGLGLLLEVESTLDFDEATNEEIFAEKNNLYTKLKNLGLSISEEKDIKKAKELIKLKYNI